MGLRLDGHFGLRASAEDKSDERYGSECPTGDQMLLFYFRQIHFETHPLDFSRCLFGPGAKILKGFSRKRFPDGQRCAIDEYTYGTIRAPSR
jgi:hypothetical protein